MREESNQSTRLDADSPQPEQSALDQLLVTMRIAASAGAIVLIVLGAILGIQLFSMLYGIVQEPTPIVTTWQQVMDDGRVASMPAAAESDAEASRVPVDTHKPASAVSTLKDPAAASTRTRDDQGHRQMRVMAEEAPPFIVLADHIMDRLETGSYSWLIGVAVLMVFCWFLIKIPGMFITTGTRLLLGLVNVSTEK